MQLNNNNNKSHPSPRSPDVYPRLKPSKQHTVNVPPTVGLLWRRFFTRGITRQEQGWFRRHVGKVGLGALCGKPLININVGERVGQTTGDILLFLPVAERDKFGIPLQNAKHHGFQNKVLALQFLHRYPKRGRFVISQCVTLMDLIVIFGRYHAMPTLATCFWRNQPALLIVTKPITTTTASWSSHPLWPAGHRS